MSAGVLWTIGHSTHPIDRFLDLLAKNEISGIADVRRFAGSRRHPQFGRDALAKSLGAAGVEYEHFPDLGGRRTPLPDSRNTAWRNAAFRGYADYMESAEFARGLARLESFAATRRAAIMCAEGLWWQCHRALISDRLKSAGARVLHIFPDGKVEEHPYSPAARIEGGSLSYRSAETRPD